MGIVVHIDGTGLRPGLATTPEGRIQRIALSICFYATPDGKLLLTFLGLRSEATFGADHGPPCDTSRHWRIVAVEPDGKGLAPHYPPVSGPLSIRPNYGGGQFSLQLIVLPQRICRRRQAAWVGVGAAALACRRQAR
ncbi:hypothetical protein [Mesorhizobium sp. LjNodule214]|uniref:hypothetical protein n=1 Tax=Mesorhizobium sp. LjNodule214 TaxID=3342252 RepID=UPI003ECF13E0